MSKKVYVFLAPGFEEVEAITPIDLLRRAGLEVATVSTNGLRTVTGAHGIMVVADLSVRDLSPSLEAEVLVLPGGMPGALNLYACEELKSLLRRSSDAKLAAICASPGVVLGQLGLTRGHNVTCYPGFEEMCIGAKSVKSTEAVVVDGRFITANGPASAMKFALAIIEETLGKDAATTVAAGLQYRN
jgi:4-methyl-5(b-hydroxyethyl)-thiazole monophosphate biosynthesis